MEKSFNDARKPTLIGACIILFRTILLGCPRVT